MATKVEPPMTEKKIVCTFIKSHDPLYFKKIFRMTWCLFAAIISKLEEFDEFVRAEKIVNVSALKSQLETLQSRNNIEKKPQFKKKKEEAAFVWDQDPSTRPKFQNHLTYSSP